MIFSSGFCFPLLEMKYLVDDEESVSETVTVGLALVQRNLVLGIPFQKEFGQFPK